MRPSPEQAAAGSSDSGSSHRGSDGGSRHGAKTAVYLYLPWACPAALRGVLKGEGASATTAPKCTKVHTHTRATRVVFLHVNGVLRAKWATP